jgi:hypothetical protein
MLHWLSKSLIVAVCFVLPNLGIWLLSNWQEILGICWPFFFFSRGSTEIDEPNVINEMPL